MSDILNPSAEDVDSWMGIVETALPAELLATRLALSNLGVAHQQARESVNVLRAELVKARATLAQNQIELTRLSAIVNSVASVLLEHERAVPQTSAPASPPRLQIVRPEGG